MRVQALRERLDTLLGSSEPGPAPGSAVVADAGRPGGERVEVVVTAEPSSAAVAEWSRLVTDTPGSDVTQLPGWARLRGTVGFNARYILAYVDTGAGSELVGGAQVLERSLPILGRVGYLPYGPVIAEGHRCTGDQAVAYATVAEALNDALAELGRRRLRVLFVQPPPGAEAVSRGLLKRGFRTSEANIAPGQSLRLDLNRDLAEIRAGLSKRLRTWTNRWTSRGVVVREAVEADLPLLADLLARTGEHQGFAAVTDDYLRTLLAELPGTVSFVGELDGAPVAAALFTRCSDTLKLRFAGMDRDEAVAKRNVPAAVQWHAIKWARDAGLRWFDFGGISAEAAERLDTDGRRDTLRGVDRFKAGFGGQIYRCPPAVEMIPGRLPRLGYDLTRRWPAGQRAIELAKRVLRTGRLGRAAPKPPAHPRHVQT